MDAPMTFGEWLRRSREGLGLTREAFGGRIGCTVSALRKIESGERRPSEQLAGLIANALDLPPAERPLLVKVARGELGVERLPPPSGAPPASTAPAPHGNLPVLPTPLIGRQRELDELGRLLRDPQCRLLTLAGPGGIGKTRLAIEAAAQVQDAFAGGAYFVALAPLSSTRQLVPAIAGAVGFAFPSAGPADPQRQLFSYLAGKQALLLLDNLEHLLPEPDVVLLAELLASAPGVKLLVTSRESSALHGEWVFEVQGLPFPESGQGEDGAQDTSVELFLQRARRAHVGFRAPPEDYPAIVRICRLVEGMPLGIELAAAWVRTLSCDEIAREIERGLGFLSLPARDLPPRHRSLRAVFEHSWKLLTAEEQDVLRHMSVFRGGFRREAAEAAAGATLPLLSALVTKSLLRRSGAGRYDLHDLIRQFAAEQLAGRPDEHEAAQAQHGRYYLFLFAQADGRLRGSAQREALAELSAEIDNFRAAWDWAVAHGEFDLIEGTLRTFYLFYDMRGWLQEGAEYLDRAIAALEAAPARSQTGRSPQVALAHLFVARALLASRLGQYDQAQALLERSVEILRPLDEPRVLVEALTFLGLVMDFTGRMAGARELYTEGLQVATAIGDRWFAALCRTCLNPLADFTQEVVEPETAVERWQSVVAEWRAIGDSRLTAIALNNLSLTALRLRRYDEARRALEESVALCLSVGDRWSLGFAYRGLGFIAQAQGEHQEAVERFGTSLDTFNELGARQDAARVLTERSWSLLALGDDAGAERDWRAALRTAVETSGTFIVVEALTGLARLQAARGEIEPALAWLLIVQGHPAATRETRERAVQLRRELETQLTAEQRAAAQARARAATLETAIDEALEKCGV